MCAPGHTRKSNDNQRQLAELTRCGVSGRPMVSKGVISFGELQVLRWPCAEAVNSRSGNYWTTACGKAAVQSE